MKKILLLFALFSALISVKSYAGDGTINNPFTVAEAMALGEGATMYYVQGYIVGGRYDDYSDRVWDDDYGISIADSPDETSVDNVLQVKLESSTGHRDIWGASSNPSVIGKEIKAHGFRDLYGGYPSFEGVDDIVEITGNGGTETVAAPTYNPSAGTYTSAQSVTISSSTDGASIYYTTDGSTPDETSTPYTVPVNISETTTLKAIAYNNGTASSVSSGTYTLEISSTDASIPYEQNFTVDVGNFIAISEAGDQVWEWANFDGGCLTVSGYDSGTRFQNTDWLISPTFDFSSFTDLQLTFREAINYINNYDELQVMVSTDYTNDVTVATWTALELTGRPTGDSWDFSDVGPVDLAAFEGESTVTIAFKYSCGTEASATWEISKMILTGTEAEVVEPSNHVTGFTASTGSITATSIELAWNENDGTNVADGYLIKASTGTIEAPADSTDTTDDTDLTDGSGNVKLAHGTSTYTFDNCSPGTTYNFSIFPYAGSADSILYKTDDAPTIQATTLSLPTEDPLAFAASGVSTSQIDLSWQKNELQQEVIVATEMYSEVTGMPADSVAYNVNDTLPGGGLVVYTGPAETFSHENLETSSYYFYKIWSVSDALIYSTGISANAATLTPEASNHAESFAIDSTGLNNIALSWTNVPGAVDPDGYLLTANAIDVNIVAPVDGTEIQGDTDLSDGTGAVVVSNDAVTYNWTGLNSNTTYVVSIYPYTNAGDNIDYKTDDAPTLTGATLAGVSTPEFSPESGTYADSVEVSISCKTVGAVIYYTLDGSTPDAGAMVYEEPFMVFDTTTVKAMAILDEATSLIGEATYNMTVTPLVVSEPVFTPEAGEYADSVLVSISSETEGSAIYYTLDGTEPNTESLLFTSPILLTETTVITAVAMVDGTASESASASFTINITPIEVDTPVISPESGEFSDSVEVSISCATPDAVIYYSLDGTAPDMASTIYTGSFKLYEGTTVTAIAYVDVFSSETASVTYVIVETVAPVEVNTLAELRAGETDGTIYHFNGEAVVTFAMDFRNQKYIQDETAAILIDDNDGIISNAFQTGDGISDLTGTLYDYNGLLEFVPTMNAAPVSTAKVIEAQEISLGEFSGNFEAYESELIHFPKVRFDAPGTFAAGNDYTISDDEGSSSVLRSHFYGVDYIDGAMIEGSFKVTGIALWHSNNAKIVPRDASDMEKLTSTDEYISAIRIYANGQSIRIVKSDDQSVADLYSFDGRRIQTVDASSALVNIDVPRKGLYIVVLKSEQQVLKTEKVIIR